MNKRLQTLTLAALAVLVLSACGGGSNGGSDGISPNPYEAPLISEADKSSYLNAINKARGKARSCGGYPYAAVPPLVWDNAMYLASAEHAQDMVISGTYSNLGSNTASDWTAQVQDLPEGGPSFPYDRAMNNGWPGNNGGELVLTELRANNSSNVSSAINVALLDEQSCNDFMYANVKRVGVARVENTWVMLMTK